MWREESTTRCLFRAVPRNRQTALKSRNRRRRRAGPWKQPRRVASSAATYFIARSRDDSLGAFDAAFTGRPSLLRAAASARRRARPTAAARWWFAGKKGAKAKNKIPVNIHFRQGPERFNAGGVGEVARGGKGGKTTLAAHE